MKTILVPVNAATARAIAAGLAIWSAENTSASPAWGLATADSTRDPADDAEMQEAADAFVAAAAEADQDADGPHPNLRNALRILDQAISVVAGAHEDMARPAEYEDAIKAISEASDEIREYADPSA